VRALAAAALAALLATGTPAHAAGTALPDTTACVRALRADALAKGIAATTFDAALAGFEPDPSVLEAMRFQPEFRTPIWDYLAGLVDEERVADGRERLAQWANVLDAAEQAYGVDRHAIVAVWGVESDFGRRAGTRALVRSLTTGSCLGTRQAFFRNELVATLRIVQSGEIPAEALTGSWAGAFGQTQFMPTTYLRLAVDFDGDGRRDIVGSVPDALGSTANYLKRAGWRTGQPWGYEVRVPKGYAGTSGRRNRLPLAQWTAAGIRTLDGKAPEGPGPAALLLPAGAAGPAFLVFPNFDAIFAYNAAESYALAIAHLADRLRGADPIVTAWPTDDRGLARVERREVQQRLIDRGHDLGVADGVIGLRSQAAIKAFEAEAGLPVTGRAGGRVLEALRAAPAKR
jgi:lytic murein transglycosylase